MFYCVSQMTRETSQLAAPHEYDSLRFLFISTSLFRHCHSKLFAKPKMKMYWKVIMLGKADWIIQFWGGMLPGKALKFTNTWSVGGMNH